MSGVHQRGAVRPPGAKPYIIDGEVKWIVPSEEGSETGSSRSRARAGIDMHAGPIATGRLSRIRNTCYLQKRNVAIVLVFALGMYFSRSVNVATVIFLAMIVVLIFTNLGTRKAGELSAYSMFNEGNQALAGDLRAEHFESQIRGGMVPGPATPAMANLPTVERSWGQGRVVGGAGQGTAGAGAGDARGQRQGTAGAQHNQQGGPANQDGEADDEDEELQEVLRRSRMEH